MRPCLVQNHTVGGVYPYNMASLEGVPAQAIKSAYYCVDEFGLMLAKVINASQRGGVYPYNMASLEGVPVKTSSRCLIRRLVFVS